MAAKEGHTGLVRILLDAGALPNPPDHTHTALRGASMFGREECVRLLLKAGADVNWASGGGRTPLMGAAMGGHAATCTLLFGSVGGGSCMFLDGDIAERSLWTAAGRTGRTASGGA